MLLPNSNVTFVIDNSSLAFYNESLYEFGDDEEFLKCPQYTKEDDALYAKITFWVDGVAVCVVAIIGLIANFLSALILAKEDMRNSFNFLLIALFCMDSIYLFASILESFRKGFSMTHFVYVILFPYLFYPLLSIAVTGSVFMTVAIAFERYIAVHYPIDYSQAINSPEACRRRLLKYVGPVVIVSILINIPKFLESEVNVDHIVDDTHPSVIKFDNGSYTFNNSYNLEELRDSIYTVTHTIGVTTLRRDPYYIMYYNNWTRLILVCILPTILLMYFNYKIYQDVKHRNRRQMSMSRSSVTATSTHQARRKQEDNLAVVFMGIVLVFLLCHTPRNLLSVAEMFMIHKVLACQNIGMRGFPVWSLITAIFSQLLLVVNSSTNMILYICLNKTFRQHFINMVKSVAKLFTSPWKKSDREPAVVLHINQETSPVQEELNGNVNHEEEEVQKIVVVTPTCVQQQQQPNKSDRIHLEVVFSDDNPGEVTVQSVTPDDGSETNSEIFHLKQSPLLNNALNGTTAAVPVNSRKKEVSIAAKLDVNNLPSNKATNV